MVLQVSSGGVTMTSLIFSVAYWILFLRKLAQLEDLKGLYLIFQVYSSIGKGVPKLAFKKCRSANLRVESVNRTRGTISRAYHARKKSSVILGGGGGVVGGLCHVHSGVGLGDVKEKDGLIFFAPHKGRSLLGWSVLKNEIFFWVGMCHLNLQIKTQFYKDLH